MDGDPDVAVMLDQARSLLRSERPQEAAAVLTELVGRPYGGRGSRGRPGASAATGWALLARAELALGRRRPATDASRLALAADGDNPEALLAAAEVALAERRVDRALDLTRHTLAVNDGHPAAWLTAGLVLAARRRWDDAERCVDAGLAADPDEPAFGTLRTRIDAGRRRQWRPGARLSTRGGALRRP